MRAFNDVDLHAFVDGQCSPDRQAAIATYLATAPGDAARVAAWRRQKTTIKELFAAVASEPVPLWLTVGQMAPPRPPSGSAVRNDPVPLRTLRRTATLDRQFDHSNGWAVALIAFVAGVSVTTCAVRFSAWTWPTPSATMASGTFLKRALETQTTFGSDPDRPVDVADVPPGHIQAWLDARVPFRARVPDLRASGWTLLGARITPNDAGPAAFLVYADAAGGRLSLFAGRTAVAPPETESEIVNSWSNAGVAYAWMSDQGDWLKRNGPLLRQAVETANTD